MVAPSILCQETKNPGCIRAYAFCLPPCKGCEWLCFHQRWALAFISSLLLQDVHSCSELSPVSRNQLLPLYWIFSYGLWTLKQPRTERNLCNLLTNAAPINLIKKSLIISRSSSIIKAFPFLFITWVLKTSRLTHVGDSVLDIFSLISNLKIIIDQQEIAKIVGVPSLSFPLVTMSYVTMGHHQMQGTDSGTFMKHFHQDIYTNLGQQCDITTEKVN